MGKCHIVTTLSVTMIDRMDTGTISHEMFHGQQPHVGNTFIALAIGIWFHRGGEMFKIGASIITKKKLETLTKSFFNKQ